MAESTPSQSVMQVSLPKAGEVAEYEVSPDVPVKFNFFVSEVLFSCHGGDLVLTGEEGGVVIIKDYQSLAMDGSLPAFELHGGEMVPGDIYLFAFSNNATDVETAAGTPETNSEMEEFLDDPVSPASLIPHGEDHSALDGSHGHREILALTDLFPDAPAEFQPVAGDEAGHALLLFGSVEAPHLPDMTVCSLADCFDPMDDALQLVVDFPQTL